MLAPKRVKWRKRQKGRNRGMAQRGFNVDFGEFGLQAVGRGRLTSRQIEAARIAMTRHMKRQGVVWIRCFSDFPVTAKPAEVRMGKGKGALDHWVANIRPGKVLYEIEGVPDSVAERALTLAAAKLPIATRIVKRGEVKV